MQIAQDKIADLLNFIAESASDTKGFVLEQAPLVAHEIVAWVFWSNLIYTIIGLTMVVFGVRVVMKFGRIFANGFKERPNDFPVEIFPMIGGFALILVASLAFLPGVAPLIKSSVAPRLVLIDEIQRMIR
jgi:hypothetical protein